MSSNSFKALTGAAIALALSGTAMANTSLDGTSNGDIFLNIIDNTNHDSYVFDTGLKESSFTGTASLPNINLATVANGNFSSFMTGASGHALTYSLVAGLSTDGGFTGSVLYTSSVASSAVTGSQLGTSWATLNNWTAVANNVSTASLLDAHVPAGSPPWQDPGVEGIFTNNLGLGGSGTGDSAAIGTALAFYSQTSPDFTDTVGLATLGKFAGTWNLTAAGILSYTVASAVPLPAPLVLLLSGLGLTGLLGRRKSLAVESDAVAV
jgi:hypothetical protein